MNKIYPILTLGFFISALVVKAQVTTVGKSLFEGGEITRNVVLKNASMINTENLDFSPVFYQSGLVYVSSRHNSGPVDKKIGETFFELFFSDTDRNGIPLKPSSFSLEINSQVHEGPVTFNKTFDVIYFTKNNDVPGEKGAGKKNSMQQIYEAQKGQFDWKNIKKLPFNRDDYHCMHPSLSPDGTKLYFASNMPGGYGKVDLYVSEKVGDRWSKPRNLGEKINSPEDDAFPFIHESGTLFFSSTRPSSYGGFDIFKVDVLSGDERVTNLQTPFNSVADDLGFIINAEGTRGYFASDRDGGFGRDDIYMFEAPEGLQGVETPTELAGRVIVYDAETRERLPNANVRIFERADDGFIEGDNLYDVQLMPSEDGEMVMKLVRKKDDELGRPKHVTDSDGEAATVFLQEKKYIVLASKDDYRSGEVVVSTVGKTEPQTVEIALEPISCMTLRGRALRSPYNDPIGSAIIKVVNQCDGTEDYVTTNIQGEFEFCLPRGCEFSVSGEKEGFRRGNTEVSTIRIRGNRSLNADVFMEALSNETPFTNEIVNEPIKKGTVLVLENIYYDFGKSAIRSGAARELDALIELMQEYPSMEIEMVAHTDARGSARYNLDLSLRRAESAKDYLINRGISGYRIKTFGFGESQPRNSCRDGVNCSEEEHQYNRRTEVKIVKINEGVDVKYRDDGPEVIDRKQ